MNRNDKITMLEQVGPICQANGNLLRIAKVNDNAEGRELLAISELIIQACERINRMGVELTPEETVDLKLN